MTDLTKLIFDSYLEHGKKAAEIVAAEIQESGVVPIWINNRCSFCDLVRKHLGMADPYSLTADQRAAILHKLACDLADEMSAWQREKGKRKSEIQW